MELEALTVAMDPLIQDYLNQKDSLMEHFDYNPYQDNIFKDRLADLQKQTYQRSELVRVLKQQYRKWGNHPSVLSNIERLADSNSVVVIGGQQAGLLTGPLYTIHKMISIIVCARQQERNLQVPVIPVFWIAGEDHDFAEINHIYRNQEHQLDKYAVKQFIAKKTPISDIALERSQIKVWLADIFKGFQETGYTHELYHKLIGLLDRADTFVDYFASITDWLLGKYGLVMVDSGDKSLREIEVDYFSTMIRKRPELANKVFKQWRNLTAKGYSIPLDLQPTDGHLFYLHKNERTLLESTEADTWVGKDLSCQFNTSELLRLVKSNPDRFSNNVITRPLMQELLFPTLAFLAGPGEIAYWSVLQPAFHILDLKVPPILPRLSFTLLDRYTAKQLEQLDYEAVDVINHGVEHDKVRYLTEQLQPPLTTLIEQIKSSVSVIHQPLREIASSLGGDLEQMAEKNQDLINEQIHFMARAIEKRIKDQHKHQLNKYDHIQKMLAPYHNWQERYWNVIFFINENGFEWLDTLIETDFIFSNKLHYLVKF
ncbi:bacillithiol biosynthesis cysteine-adding enzyme BshC [Amphibacillus sediminis]|uniref:bacillithiol biosynthesis cysteine-adding enzyme BshC n=1 Tax=Amphibacillus sediminis TaxID=360185 RepID=UPI00082B53D2|nr:bacillithiol biosynthesis cysteine-adding enzyme BshC [Amphibacillus sediminis]